jgi:hypothetical protein
MTTDPFETDPVLMRAVGYPYDITAHSFTFIEGEAAPFDAAHTIGRRPVIGYGSNQSPLRLRQKYGTDHAPIPVQRAWLDDHDVVFAAHFAGYGALPAALRHVPGTRVAVAVTWLSDAELAVMHPTEIEHYHFARLEGLTLDLDGGETIDAAWAGLRPTKTWRRSCVRISTIRISVPHGSAICSLRRFRWRTPRIKLRRSDLHFRLHATETCYN